MALLTVSGAFSMNASAQVAIDTLDVSDMSFEGNDSFRASAIRTAILTEDTHCRSVLLAPFCWIGSDWAIEDRTLNRPELTRDMARIRLFYFRRGYREASVETVVVEQDGAASVTFLIDEGRPVLVGSVEVSGGDPSTLGDLALNLPSRIGQPLSLLQLEASREALISRLRDNGYAHAEVLAGFTIPAEDPFSASIVFESLPGAIAAFGPIRVQGIESLDDATVRSVLPIEQGDLFSERRLADAQRNVFELEIVRHAEIVVDLSHVPDTIVPLDVRVMEAAPHRIRTGGGVSTAECLAVEGRWTSLNFQGGGRRLQASARLWNALADELASSVCSQAGTGVYGRINYRLGLDFLQPVFLGPRNSLSTRLFFERESFPDLFVRQTVGTNLMFSRSIGRLSATGLFYQPEYGSYEAADVYFCSNFLICSPEEIALASSANVLAPVGLSFSTDQTNPVMNPVRGWNGLIGLETAGQFTFSDYAYQRVVVEGAAFTELGRGSQRVLGGRIRLGVLNPQAFGGVTTESTDIELSAPQKRFYAGGASSVRGFAAGRLGPRNLQTDVLNLVQAEPGDTPICTPEQILDLSCDANPLGESLFVEAPSGGNIVLIGNIEYRAWLAETLQAAVYLDFGQVWSDRTVIDWGTVEFTPGVGIRYPTPIGPLRLDLAYHFRQVEHLPAITSQLEPLDPTNPKDVVVTGSDGTKYVVSDGLAPLIPPVAFGSDDLLSFNRFQLHFSIGQAF